MGASDQENQGDWEEQGALHLDVLKQEYGNQEIRKLQLTNGSDCSFQSPLPMEWGVSRAVAIIRPSVPDFLSSILNPFGLLFNHMRV
jgi:hypothetical protein